jgi:hypothetical protein
MPNGQVLVAGTFSSINGISRPGLVRLNGDVALDHSPAWFHSLKYAGGRTVELELDVFPNRNVEIQTSTNLTDWLPLGTYTASGYSLKATAFSDAGPARFYRAVGKEKPALEP